MATEESKLYILEYSPSLFGVLKRGTVSAKSISDAREKAFRILASMSKFHVFVRVCSVDMMENLDKYDSIPHDISISNITNPCEMIVALEEMYLS